MGKWIASSVALAVLALVSLAPLAMVGAELLGGGEQSARAAGVFSDPAVWRLFGRSALVAAGSAGLAAALGAGLALFGTPRRGRWLAVLAIGPLVVPPTVYGLGWRSAGLWVAAALRRAGLAGGGLPGVFSPFLAGAGCALVMGMAFAPLVAMAVLAARRLQDPAAWEAALVGGVGPARRLARLEFPPIAGAAGAGAVAVFLLSLSQFEIPSALNCPSLTEEVYARFQETYSLGAPGALGLLPAVGAVGLALCVWRRLARVEPLGALPVARRATEGRGVAPWLIWGAFVAAGLGAPAAGLAAHGLNRQALAAMGPDLAQGLRDSLGPALAGAALCLGLGWALADLALERRRVGALALCVALAPAAVAPAVVGVGIIRLWHRPVLEGLVYGRSGGWVLAWGARFLGVALLTILAARRALGREFLEAARTAAVPERLRHGRLLAPALASTLAAVGAACLALMLGELGAASLLSAPGVELISQRLHSRVHIGPESQVAALSLLYGFAALGLGALAWRLARWGFGTYEATR